MEAIPLCPIGNIIALTDFVSGYGAQKLLRAGGVTSFVKRYDAREFRNEILSLFNCDGHQPYANCSIGITGK